MEVYQYVYRDLLVLAPWEAAALAKGGRVRVGLGSGWAYSRVSGDEVIVEYRGRVYTLDKGSLLRAGRDKYAWVYTGGRLVRAEVRGSGFAALEPVGRGVPTVWINGIHMHRVVDVDPLEDTRYKVRAARVGRGHRVLDVCTGLGYTAIASLRRGARNVVTIEVSEDIIYLASLNPWSRMLEDDRITVIRGDAVEAVTMLEGGFDRIIHDPPRFTPATGDLYSLDFYRELYRLLKPGGILFHYTGEPGRRRRVNLPGSVASRLRRAGFEVIGYDKNAKGVVAKRMD